MYVKRVVAGILIILTAIAANANAVRYPSISYPHGARSVASVDGTDAVFYNPAVMKSNPYLEMQFYHSFDDSTFDGDNGLVFSRGGLGLGYYSLKRSGEPSVSSWTIALASRYNKRLLVGSSYTFYKTDRQGFHNDHFWKIGMVYRPNRKLSLAAVANNLNRMEFEGDKTSVEYTVGGGLRPFGEKITLSGDYLFYGGEKFKHGRFTAFADIKLKDGMWVSGHADENKFFGIGLSLAFGRSVVESYAYFDDEPEFGSGVVSYGYSYNTRGYALLHPNRYTVLKLSGSYPEERQTSFLWKKERRTFSDLILGLDRIRDDAHITGIALYLDHPKFGFAQLEELRVKIMQIKARGKEVVCFLAPLSGTGSYYLASACDKIAMQRLDQLEMMGLRAEVTFYKGTLDKLGIDAQLEHIGDYKTASDLVTRDSMSVCHREAVDALLDDIWDQVMCGIAESRAISSDSLMLLIDNAPITSVDALEAGLVDTLIYPDEFEDWAGAQLSGASPVTFKQYIDIGTYDARWGELPCVAIIPAEGSITDGVSGNSLFTGKSLGSETLNQAIRRARTNESVKAVVLRVNSPGGQVLGSESIWRELKLTQEQKPVIVSMSNVAASGGYHISSASDYILAQNSTVTGSIGVIYGKLDLSRLRENLGFSTYIVKRGDNADFFSMAHGFTDEQRLKLHKQIRLVYDDFVNTVAENRGMTYDEVDEVAQGRIWSGNRAFDRNLIDGIGGISDAIDTACQLARIKRRDVVVEIVPTRQHSAIPSLQPLATVAGLIRLVTHPEVAEIPDDFAAGLGNGYYFRSPYEIRIK
ncbi:MAG: signal peptide peptidase SppA [candidate division Zixibacteria bacterium]|nr:signal peptide peptidase SppA [candidate division Zixibacteria bacterium]MBU1470483.1 signal peptide peptidase SppA [candidate division Zixibacteria bacterium]MBU2625932.1 signal peptide peptidase SppA [candidate division Zixibacteria bacterium]